MSNTKKLYEKIIDNRFKISGILIIVLGILGFFLNDLNIKDWVLTTDKLFCFWWNIKFCALSLISYELLLMITNDKKGLAFIGTLLLVFSGTVRWNFNVIDSFIIGELIVVVVKKYFKTEFFDKKLPISIAIILLSICYALTYRPYVISFGYLFIGLIIWTVLKNRDPKNVVFTNTLILNWVTLILSIVGSVSCFLIFNNNYIEIDTEGFHGISTLFTYLYNCFLPFSEFEGKELLGSIISIFPIPMIVGLYYMYKKEDHVEFILPVTVLMVFEAIYCISGFPEIINKITFLSDVDPLIVMDAVQISNFFIMFYFLGNVKEELFKISHSMRITLLVVCFLIFLRFPTVYSTKKYLYFFVCELSLFSFLFLNFSDKRYQKVLLFFLLVVTLIGAIPVNF